LEAKVRGLLAAFPGRDRAEALIRQIGELESLGSIGALRPLLQA
jgi:hypothetical protein